MARETTRGTKKYYLNVDRSRLRRNASEKMDEPCIQIFGPKGSDHAREVKLLGEVTIVQKLPGQPDYPGNAVITVIADDIEKVR